MRFLLLIPSLGLGLIIGANDAANVIGPVLTSGAFRRRHLIFVSAGSCFLGALLAGRTGVLVNSALADFDPVESAVLYSTVIPLVLYYVRRGIPVSVTQVIVGATVGYGLLEGHVDVRLLFTIAIGWFLTPLVGFLLGFVVYRSIAVVFRLFENVYIKNLVLRYLLRVLTVYGAFSLGSNSVGKFTGALYSAGYSLRTLLLLGASALTLGLLLLGHRSAYTVAKSVVPLDNFSALVCLVSSSLTLYIFSLPGLPISPSHAIVSSVVGIGYARGVSVRDERTIKMIFLSWVVGPVLGAAISSSVFSIVKLLW